ncbi:MAG TPA: trehalose-phosphatase [Ignavibacteriales bacterium]|nr:trehalose-phosphatase [Ignavibacteriales bacterium]
MRLSTSGKVILLLDYDGTLAPICRRPDLAVLSPAMRKLLSDLKGISSITLALVTGRSHEDIRRMVRLKDIIYVSNHGFQIRHGRKCWVHPEVKTVRTVLQGVSLLLEESLREFYMAVVENKKFTLSVHYRGEENKNAAMITRAVRRLAGGYPGSLKAVRGKKVIELRPDVAWNKGAASLKLLSMLSQQQEAPLVIYIGDDKTDEDAFRELERSAVTIRVGRGCSTSAKYRLRSVGEVEKLLMMIKSEKCPQL